MRSFISFLKLEFRSLSWLLSLFLLVVLCLTTIITTLWSAAISIPKEYNDKIEAFFTDGYVVYVEEGFDDTDNFFKYGADCLSFDSFEITYSANIISEYGLLSWTYGNAIFFNGKLSKSSFAYNARMVSGRDWPSEDIADGSIWISEHASKELGVTVGDVVSFVIDEQNTPFEVVGIFVNEFSEELWADAFYNFVISYASALELYFKHNLSDGRVNLYVYNVFDILPLADNLTKNNIKYGEGMIPVVERVTMIERMRMTLLAVLAIIFIMGELVIFSFVTIILNTRKKTFGLYKTLGYKNKNILRIVFFIMFTLLLISVLLGSFLSIPVNSLLVTKINKISEFDLTIKLIWYTPLLILGANFVIFEAASLWFTKRIKRINLIGLLTAED